MKFENFNSQDFINNDFFISWVIHPDDEKNAYWEIFLSLHPEKYQDIMKAKAVIASVKESHRSQPDDFQIEKMWKNIISETDIEQPKPTLIKLKKRFVVDKLVYLVSAAVIIMMFGSWYFFIHNDTLPTYNRLTTDQDVSLIEMTNPSSKIQKILLPDGSSVLLTQGSKISFPKIFGSTRKVFLEGDGFFEVKKNPQSPFIVYAGELVTKVLGTSFWIKGVGKQDNIEVEVKTGCVAVSHINSTKQAFSDFDPKFSLVANQKAVYSKEEKVLKKLLIENPVPINQENDGNILIYNNKPVVEIFEEMKIDYKIDFFYDKETLKNCQINSRFTDESFFERLTVLCKIINANYEVVETQIIIKAKGCN